MNALLLADPVAWLCAFYAMWAALLVGKPWYSMAIAICAFLVWWPTHGMSMTAVHTILVLVTAAGFLLAVALNKLGLVRGEL